MAVEHKMQDELIVGLKEVAQHSFEALGLHFFSRDDEPLLQSIVQKGLDSIMQEQKNRIKSKWLLQKSK